MTRTARFAQSTLIIVFMSGFAINIAAVVLSWARGVIYIDLLQGMVVQLLAIYAMPLGAILGGVFGQRSDAEAAAPAQAFWVALAVALLWNVLLTARVLVFALGREDDVSELTDYLAKVSAASAFLIAGTLAFYFARKTPG
jgi:hypothetical protein